MKLKKIAAAFLMVIVTSQLGCDSAKDLRDALSGTQWVRQESTNLIEFTKDGDYIEYYDEESCYYVDAGEYTINGSADSLTVYFGDFGYIYAFTLDGDILTIGSNVYERDDFDGEDFDICEPAKVRNRP